jgi:uncharacterized protein (DUF2062 family)
MGWARERIREPLLSLLRQGLSPRGLAWSLAVGLALGTIPLLGTSTLLCVGLAAAFRLNQPAMQLANYLAYPLQILLFYPFLRMGGALFGLPHETISLGHLQAALRSDAWGALRMSWSGLWHASVAWALVVPLPTVLLAWGLTPVFRRALETFRRP